MLTILHVYSVGKKMRTDKQKTKQNKPKRKQTTRDGI